ncbi:tetratricopeptide repeat protein [Paraliobacillus salinarum]|uniref:tetratricopeptide repeat protein n=1 Tax=Paraliobacillus salinarum TaxID=1158996 RepID=UPI0015F5A974|nr:tetratricopeptide repeat protein [Paraliobacillus salinarum]
MNITQDNKSIDTSANNVIPFIPEGDFYFSKGVQAFQKRKFDIALKWFKKATEADPKEPLYPCQMSIIYTEIGAYHAANQILTEVIEKQGDDYLDCYYLIANNYAHLGLLRDAKKYATIYLEKDPEGEFKEETEQLLSVLEISEDEIEDEDWLEEEDELLIYQETAFYHLERRDWDKALSILQEMMTLFPDHITAKHEYAYALFFSGEEREALELEERWLSEDPNSIFCLTNLMMFYHERAKQEELTKIQQSLVNIFPIHEQQKLRIAVAFAHVGAYQLAYNRFLTLSKKRLRGHINYYRYFADAAYHVDDKRKAENIWEEGAILHSVLNTEQPPWEKLKK